MDFEKEQLGEWGIPSFPLGEVARNASRVFYSSGNHGIKVLHGKFRSKRMLFQRLLARFRSDVWFSMQKVTFGIRVAELLPQTPSSF